MDNKIHEFGMLIETHKVKYPNVCLLWEKYMEIKQNTLEDQLNIAIDKLSKIDDTLSSDISMDNLVLLTIFQEIG